MKKVVLRYLVVALAVSYLGCKKSDSQGPTATGTTENYFPNNEGTNYKFSYSRIDSLGTHQGIRFTRYGEKNTIFGTSYKIQIDSLVMATSIEVDSSYFRTTGSGVYYFIDTTGFAASITDSTLLQFLPFIKIDNELLSYSFPLLVGKYWTVFKMILNYPGSPTTTLVDVFAQAVSKDTITLNLQNGPILKEAIKIKYTLLLTKNPTPPQVLQTFNAEAWIIQDIGPAKWEGSGTLVNIITGLGIDFGDTTTVVNQSLIDYQIK